MPVVSAIDAVAQKYAGLPGSLTASLWFGEAQSVLPSGAATDFPLLIYYHEGSSPITSLEAMVVQIDTFRIEAWADTEAAVRSLIEAVMWGGSTPSSRAGFWLPLTFPTPTGWTFKSCLPAGLPSYETVSDPRVANAKQFYRSEFRFTTMFDRT